MHTNRRFCNGCGMQLVRWVQQESAEPCCEECLELTGCDCGRLSAERFKPSLRIWGERDRTSVQDNSAR